MVKLAKLAATTQAEHQVQGALLLDVIISQSTAVLQLLAGKDQPLLVWRDACSREAKLRDMKIRVIAHAKDRDAAGG